MLIWITTEDFRLQARSVTFVDKIDQQEGSFIRITVDKDWRKYIQVKKENLELLVDERSDVFDHIYIKVQFFDIS